MVETDLRGTIERQKISFGGINREPPCPAAFGVLGGYFKAATFGCLRARPFFRTGG